MHSPQNDVECDFALVMDEKKKKKKKGFFNVCGSFFQTFVAFYFFLNKLVYSFLKNSNFS